MKSYVNQFKIFLLAFLAPMVVRFIPEIIAWPYPIGFDTLIYAGEIFRGTYLKVSFSKLLKSASLFYILSSWANMAFGNPILTLKLLAPLIFGFLCGSLYFYCQKAFGWDQLKALAASLLAGTYFVSLRISWEMYRQMLGLIFLICALTALRIRGRLSLVLTAIFGFLAAWSHELAAVLFFVMMAAHFLAGHISSRLHLALATTPALLLFLYQLYNPAAGTIHIPSESFISSSWTSTFSFISGFLIYMFLPLLPLAVLGALSLRSPDVWSWIAACLLFSYWPVFLPQSSVVFWFRWAILLVYPVIFLSVEGLWKLWFSRRNSSKLNLRRALAVSMVLINAGMSACYLVTLPEHAFIYFGEWNNYKQFIQTSMLQNSVSIVDTPSVIEALKWAGRQADSDSVLVLHEAMGYWANILIGQDRIILVKENELSSQLRENATARLLACAEEEAEKGNEVYTVWWVDGKGWYDIRGLPPQFREVRRFGNIGIFRYMPAKA